MNRVFEIFRHRWNPKSPEELPRNVFHYKHFNDFLSSALDLFFPPQCLLCETYDASFVEPTCCKTCWQSVFEPQSVPLADGSPWVFAYAGALYRGAVRRLIRSVKFNCDPLPLSILERLLIETSYAVVGEPPDLVTSVPFNRKHLQKRGIDLPGYLAKKLARRMKVPYDRNALVRLRNPPAQQKLSKQNRLKNLSGAFDARKPLHQRHVLLVDDIITTGATVSIAASCLLRAGAQRVTVISLAATPQRLHSA